jgi:hypothetical protein
MGLLATITGNDDSEKFEVHYGAAPGLLAHKDGSRLAIVLDLNDGRPSWATFPMSRRGLR